MNNCTLYFHYTPGLEDVFYVGIGLKSRFCSTHGRNKHWKNHVTKYGFIPKIIESGLTFEQAREKEIFWIKFFGRKDKGEGLLLNYTDGGEGAFGAIRSQEIRLNMSKAAKNRKKYTLTEEHKQNISKGGKGRVVSENQRQLISEANKVHHKDNPNMGMNGKACSEETKRKIGAANTGKLKGRKLSQETINKMVKYRTGRKLSEETKRKIGNANRKKAAA